MIVVQVVMFTSYVMLEMFHVDACSVDVIAVRLALVAYGEEEEDSLEKIP